jgi:CheY-like chemotaxis protein
VDDIDYNRLLIRSYLEGADLDIYEAKNGREAIEAAKAVKPDVILMDMKMPEMNGYEACAYLKQDREVNRIPIIAVTASAWQKDEQLASRYCVDYLRKPLNRGDLVEALMRCLPHRELEPDEAVREQGSGDNQDNSGSGSAV